MNIVEKVGTPAALEQLAEECTELAKAALKLARHMRGENPSIAPIEMLADNFHEEVGGVRVCLDVLIDHGDIDTESVSRRAERKRERWERRITRMEEKKNAL